jgi:hypothetical protein
MARGTYIFFTLTRLLVTLTINPEGLITFQMTSDLIRKLRTEHSVKCSIVGIPLPY